MSRIGEALKRNTPGYARTADAAAQLVPRGRARVSAAIATVTSSDPLHNAAVDAAETLKNKIATEAGDTGVGFEYDGLYQDEKAALILFGTLETNLTLNDGSINHQSILLNDRDLLNTLINLSSDKDFSSQFRNRAKDLVNTVIIKSANKGGFFSSSCPKHIVDVLSNRSDDPDSKTKRYTAVVELILDLAKKNTARLDVSEVVNNLLNDLPTKFAGDLGEIIEPMLQETISDVLSSTSDIFNDPDLEINATLLKRYAQSIGNLFISGVTKPLRNEDLVVAAQDLLIAYETSDRNYGAHQSIGIETARQNFINLWFTERDKLNIQEAELNRLRTKAEEVRTKIKTGSKVQLDQEFCTDTEKAGSLPNEKIILTAQNHHITSINARIRKLETELQESRVKFDKKLTAIKLSFENISSPFQEGHSGIRDMFFERIIGRTADGQEISKDNLTELFIRSTDEDSIEFSLLSDANYGKDFQGLRKQTLANLKAINENIPNQLHELESFELALSNEVTTLTNSYQKPLIEIIGVDKLFDQSHINKLNQALHTFCKEENKVNSTIDKIKTSQSKAIDIIESLIVKDASGNFILDQSKLDTETNLTDLEKEDLKKVFEPILINYNIFHKDETNKNKKFDFSSVNDEAHKVISSIQTKVKNTYSSDEDTSDITTLSALTKEYDRHLNIASNEVANLLEYERDALSGSSTTLGRKLTQLATDLGINFQSVIDLVTPDLKSKISRATILRNDSQKISKEKATLEVLNDPNHPDFNEAWEAQLRTVSMKQVFTMTIGHDLNKLGLSANNAKVLIDSINDSDIFEIYEDQNTAYGTMIMDFFSKLMQFLLQLSNVRSNEQN